MNTINVILNGKPVVGYENETIYELATRLGYSIPTLCHDPRLEPFSSCFVCVVYVDKMRGLQPSCSTKITEGMIIDTESEEVRKARQAALNLLLSNHYADCIAPCKQTCPAGVDVQGYISLIEKGLYSEAVALIKETNPLPAICGRVCVRPCEVACRRNLLDEGAGVGIDYLKRFAADKDLEKAQPFKPAVAPSTGKKIAIIGAGPGGLSAAYFLQQKGHQCDIYEAAPEVGGWLRYGIPEYRLPNDVIDREVKQITDLGVRIFCNKKLGDNLSYAELNNNYDATIITIGSQKGTLVGVEGEDAENVFSGIDFLRNMAITGQKYDFRGKTIAVVGGGNTAMDCCRTSVRCGAEKVYVIYRRTEKEMPANPIEIHESKLEGVEYMFLTNPVKINKDEKGRLKSVTCIRMELGEPDASGRRRPIPVEGSEFDIEVDYLLAAIGQKTDVNFIDDINKHSKNGQLKINKWGDIQVNPQTLQTDIPNVFAAGDCVTGPATVIEAIKQAKIASESCHKYLMGLPLQPDTPEFISKRENFKEQTSSDYVGKYKRQLREEMPVLPPSERNNFNEVELGYASEEVAKHETARCLECGCSAVYTCDLKKYATEYNVTQTKYSGDFKEYEVDFSHPFIEIDNNKCILCGRCIRICREVVGANALGFVNRGFETFVAPSMQLPLQETTCEACGNCISTCPTGALTENVPFKPGPIKTDSFETICPFCSIGCKVIYHHKSSFLMKATGDIKLNNKVDGNLCKFGRFGYYIFNNKKRITKPLLKQNGKYVEISFEEAYKIIKEQISKVQPDENAFSVGTRLTNEEMYLIQKIARVAGKTNNVFSFNYLERGKGYHHITQHNVPFEQVAGAKQIFLLGSEINIENPVLGYIIQNAKFKNNIPVSIITNKIQTSLDHKVNSKIVVKSYYHFIKAVNYYLITNNKYNALFINEHVKNFEEYVNHIKQLSYSDLINQSGVEQKIIEEFADSYNSIHESILVYAEKNVDSSTACEITNLLYLTGKAGKHSAGVIALREKNNSQGIFDMGICPKISVGTQNLSDTTVVEKLKKVWKVSEIPTIKDYSIVDLFKNGNIKNLFIFGEDPLGCAIDKTEINAILNGVEFICVQDCFMSETASRANLILPASFSFETDGSFTSTQKIIQNFNKSLNSPFNKTNFDVLNELQNYLGITPYNSQNEVFDEIASLLPETVPQKEFVVTQQPHNNRRFEYGCDVITKMCAEYLENKYEFIKNQML